MPEKKDKPKSQKEKEKKQTEIDKVVEQLAIFKIKQREKEGDEESHEQLSNYWLRYKISRVEDSWNAEKGVELKHESEEGPGPGFARQAESKMKKGSQRELGQHVKLDKGNENTSENSNMCKEKTDTDTYVREAKNKAGGVTDVSLD